MLTWHFYLLGVVFLVWIRLVVKYWQYKVLSIHFKWTFFSCFSSNNWCILIAYRFVFLRTCVSQVSSVFTCALTLISQTAGAEGFVTERWPVEREKLLRLHPEAKCSSRLHVLAQVVDHDFTECQLIERVQSTCLPVCSQSIKKFALRPWWISLSMTQSIAGTNETLMTSSFRWAVNALGNVKIQDGWGIKIGGKRGKKPLTRLLAWS